MKIKLTYVSQQDAGRAHRDPASMLGQRYFLACSAFTYDSTPNVTTCCTVRHPSIDKEVEMVFPATSIALCCPRLDLIYQSC